MKTLILLLAALDAPPLAFVLDQAGQLTPIYGVAGNFIPGRPGPSLLAYSNDGEIEWRLEPGRLTATRASRTYAFPTAATRANFRGSTAYLPNETIRLDDEPESQLLAGRAITWSEGKLRITQPGGSQEELTLPYEPERMSAAAANWAYLIVNGRAHLLRLTPGRVELFVLPQRSRE
ncbi:MAG: hypothetical protein HYX27_06545 [Acidobacteria bacterium]|nr:hypothetical protein [Acidobacteriota bacterium]